MAKERWLSETGLCITCGGDREIRVSDGIEYWEVPCPECKGTGFKSQEKKKKTSPAPVSK